jgi:hypothetical protein
LIDVQLIRLLATAAATAVLSAGLVLIHPPAQAAPQSAPQSTSRSTPAADADAAQLTPPPAPHRKAQNPAATVMRGGDTTSLVALLPWWRADASRAPDSDPGQLESPVLTACDLWLGFPFATADAESLTVRLSAAQHASAIDLVANPIRIIDPGELNEIDLTAPDEPAGANRSWLHGLLVLLGGVLAAISAARYLSLEGHGTTFAVSPTK